MVKEILVSIHVPARGTTLSRGSMKIITVFQSTFPQGERHCTIFFDSINIVVSIHVPARGTTLASVDGVTITPVSIHVPARGTTAIIYKFPLYFLLLSMQLYQYNPGNASPADHTHITLSQYYGANLPDTLCPLLFRTDPVLYCCFI